MPGSFATLKMTPDDVGEWAIVCRTNDHYSAGMQAKYSVQNCQNKLPAEPSGPIRRYYIAAIEEEWDYAPSGRNVLEGVSLEESEYVLTL